MACIKKEGNAFENLTGYNTFIKDRDLNSQYFKVSKFSTPLVVKYMCLHVLYRCSKFI